MAGSSAANRSCNRVRVGTPLRANSSKAATSGRPGNAARTVSNSGQNGPGRLAASTRLMTAKVTPGEGACAAWLCNVWTMIFRPAISACRLAIMAPPAPVGSNAAKRVSIAVTRPETPLSSPSRAAVSTRGAGAGAAGSTGGADWGVGFGPSRRVTRPSSAAKRAATAVICCPAWFGSTCV